ncbi:phosphoserine phosphatase SerB [Nitriliruptor alkaliphilus]|uniref:phosphoserine phosphatase SerB n=1 Tax=Nitriliruptor alkaliphilus TaxID=427918 RepID=UPI00069748A3|nr:phosphoserine phosphatase SerB [Nitriliruptor alkaliphilus]
MSSQRTILVRVSGRDRPGITTGLLGVLAASDVDLYDMEQVVVRERLTLDLLIGVGEGDDALKELLFHGFQHDLQLDFEVVEDHSSRSTGDRAVVTVIASHLPPASLRDITGAIAAGGGNIDRIGRLSRYPVVSFEFLVVGGDVDRMRAHLVAAAATHTIDVAIQRESLGRRAKRLVVMDVDSTLIQDEVIELMAVEAGCADRIADITERTMRGELDFTVSLTERVAMLAGTPVEVLDRVGDAVRLTPGARTFVRTLKRLGYTVAIVSGGFSTIVDRLGADLKLDHAVANELEIVDGRLTGRLLGEVIDRAGKARVLERIAAAEGIPLEQTVAIGDGANDLDMLAVAGLGIAFNAKPVVREAADTAVSVPYLDAILFLLGIRRDEIEAADAEDPELIRDGLIPVPGTPPL